MHHDKPPVFPLQPDGHVPGLLAGRVGLLCPLEVHRPVVAKLALLIGKVNLGPGKYSDVLGEQVVGVDVDPAKGSELAKGKVHLQRACVPVLPSHPVVA